MLEIIISLFSLEAKKKTHSAQEILLTHGLHTELIVSQQGLDRV